MTTQPVAKRKFQLPAWAQKLLKGPPPTPIMRQRYEAPLYGPLDHLFEDTGIILGASVIISAVAFVSYIVFKLVLSYGSLEAATVAVLAEYMLLLCRAGAASCELPVMLSGLVVGVLLVVTIGVYFSTSLGFDVDTSEVDEVHEHLALLDKKIVLAHYANDEMHDFYTEKIELVEFYLGFLVDQELGLNTSRLHPEESPKHANTI